LVTAKEPPKFKVSGFYVRETKFQIPPGVKDYTIVAERTMSQESELFRFIPHMHLRGKSERIEVIFPDGTIRVPLEIKRWNPDWQFAYVLKEPIPMPVGT